MTRPIARPRHPATSLFSRLLVLVTFLSALAPLVSPAPAFAQGARPVLAAYYAWYDQNTWTSGKLSDQPVTPYHSADRATIDAQVAEAQGAGIDAFALNWWGPGNPTDTNLQTLFSVAHARNFKALVDFDLSSPFVNNPGDATNVLTYATRYFADPSYFTDDGKPVVFFYGTRKYDVGTWGAIRAKVDPNHQARWIAEGDDFSYLTVFDGIYPYSVAWSSDPSSQLASYAAKARSYPGKLWVATVMPGYDDTRLGRSNSFAVNRENGGYYASMWNGAIATNPDMVQITSFNEWMEGTQIEPSKTYGDAYLHLTKQYADAYRGSNAPAASSSGGPGAFYTQAGQGKGGYRIDDSGGITFYDAFRALGGSDALGYPSSQRFQKDGFTYQATQGALLQWRPDQNRAVLANTFEWFTDAGKDDWLYNVDGIPRPIRDDGSGGDYNKAKQTRLSWMTDDAIRAKFLSAGSVDDAINLYGLPMSYPEKHGPFVVQRFQRMAFQHWVEDVPGMPPKGSVVRILGGDYLKQLGLIPAAAAVPTSS